MKSITSALSTPQHTPVKAAPKPIPKTPNYSAAKSACVAGNSKLKKSDIALNRKMLAQLAVLDKDCFAKVVQSIK